MARDPARHARCTVAYSTQKIVGKTLAGLPCPKGQNTDFIRISTRTIVFFAKPCRYFFHKDQKTDFIRIFSLNITLIPGCWKKHHHGRSRVPIVYTGGNTSGETRADQSSGSTGRQGVVFLGFYIDGLHSQNPQRYQGPYSDFKKVDTLFFRSSIRIPMFEGLTIVFFSGKGI